MADSVDKHLVTQFSDMMHNKAQQIKARLRPYVQLGKMTGDVWAYDGLGNVEAQEVIGRVQKTEFQDIDHLRRKLSRRRFAVTLPIDSSDIAGMLTDPQGRYAEACQRAMERVFDRVVIEAMFADVKTGREFDTTVTASSDGVLTVDATAGLTYAKLLEIGENFINNEVGTDVPEKLVFGIAGKEHTALLNLSQLTSGDFSRDYAIENGEITRAAGLEIIKYGSSIANPMLAVAAGVRSCFAMSTRAMFVGLSENFDISVKDRPDYVGVKQVQIIGTLGAVRTEGALIQKVTTTV